MNKVESNMARHIADNRAQIMGERAAALAAKVARLMPIHGLFAVEPEEMAILARHLLAASEEIQEKKRERLGW